MVGIEKSLEEKLPHIPFQQQGARQLAWGMLGAAKGWSDMG